MKKRGRTVCRRHACKEKVNMSKARRCAGEMQLKEFREEQSRG